MPAQFRNASIQAYPGEKPGDFRTQASRWNVVFTHRNAKDVPHLFFHATAVALGTTLQTSLNGSFDIADYELSHIIDIMISHLTSSLGVKNRRSGRSL